MTPMDKLLIYDTRYAVPDEIKNLLGVDSFAEVIYRKRSLQRWVEDTCTKAGLPAPVSLFRNAGDDLLHRRAFEHSPRLVILYFPAYIAFRSPEDQAALFLKKLSLSKHNLTVRAAAPPMLGEFPPAISVVVGDLAKAFLDHLYSGLEARNFFLTQAKEFVSIPDDAGIIDLRDPMQFVDYLTSNFDVRYFNQVRSENTFVVVKQSTDRNKIRREHAFYGLLPPQLQMFFVQPFDLTDDGQSASYKMERLFVPDMALQWIHGALSELQFQRFLEHVFYFIGSRPRKVVGADETAALREEIYLTKVSERVRQLQSQPGFAQIDAYLRPTFGGLDALCQRYMAMYRKLVAPVDETTLSVGHGDLCFSNMLYSKTTGLLKFIDPRGADKPSDLYMHSYYDVAKLSHSVLGNYDFINVGLFKLEIASNLKVELLIEGPERLWAERHFLAHLAKYGFDASLVRLYEVSLFISMTPLHIDLPKKVLAFLIHAERLLSDLEQA